MKILLLISKSKRFCLETSCIYELNGEDLWSETGFRWLSDCYWSFNKSAGFLVALYNRLNVYQVLGLKKLIKKNPPHLRQPWRRWLILTYFQYNFSLFWRPTHRELYFIKDCVLFCDLYMSFEMEILSSFVTCMRF